MNPHQYTKSKHNTGKNNMPITIPTKKGKNKWIKHINYDDDDDDEEEEEENKKTISFTIAMSRVIISVMEWFSDFFS